MSLLTYEDARPWARAMKMRTGLRNKRGAMPPWFIERDLGIQQYKNDISLSEEEIGRIAAWADSRRAARRPRRPAASARVPGRERVGDRRAGSDRRVALGRRAGRRAGQVDLARHDPDRPRGRSLRGGGRGQGVQRHPAGRHRRHRRRALRVPPHDLRRRGARRLRPFVVDALPGPRGRPQRGHLPGQRRAVCCAPGRRSTSRPPICTRTAARRART